MDINFFTIILLSFGIGAFAVVVGVLIVKYKDMKLSKEIYYDIEASRYGIELRKLNEKLLKKERIIFDKTLPMYLYDKEYEFKDIKSIIKRALCLYCVVDYAINFNAKDSYSIKEKKLLKAKRNLRKFGVLSELTEKEKELIENPSQKLVKKIAFQKEGLLVLTYALNLIENIELPYKQCDFSIFEKIYEKTSFSVLSETCKLRTDSELVKLNDLNFLCQWACNEENYVGKRLSKLNTEATQERFRASAWLVSKQDNWDRIDLSA